MTPERFHELAVGAARLAVQIDVWRAEQFGRVDYTLDLNPKGSGGLPEPLNCHVCGCGLHFEDGWR